MVILACGRSQGIGEVGVEHGSTSVADLAVMVGEHECADVRLALVREVDGWRIWHGKVTLGAAGLGFPLNVEGSS